MKKMKFVLACLLSFALILSLAPTAFASNQIESSSCSVHSTSEEICSMFELNDLTEVELKEICDRVNGVDGLEHNDAFCLTTANALIEYYYSKYSKQRTNMPDYLLSAYNTITEEQEITSSTYTSRSSSYIISNSGRFRVYYDNAGSYENLIALAQFTGILFDQMYTKYCVTYEFPAPISNTDDGYYNINIIPEETLNASGVTYHVLGQPQKTYILISQDQLVNYYENIDSSVRGVIAHELMHAILRASGIYSSSSIEAASLHEAMARAVGIETIPTYANRSNICSDIQSFILQLHYSIGSIETAVFINGSAVFYLSIFEEYQDWEVMETMCNNFDSDQTILSNLSSTLDYYYNDSIGNRYEKFLIYAVAPDHYFESSPSNNQSTLPGTIYSWGSPHAMHTINVSSTNETIRTSAPMSLPYLACNYIKITANNSATKKITVTVYYNIADDSTAEPFGACVIHNSSTNSYTTSSGIVYDNELYTTFTMSISGNDVAYIAIANGGLYGDLQYTYEINISN